MSSSFTSSFYASAPTSPNRSLHQNIINTSSIFHNNFYSPIRGMLDATSDTGSGMTSTIMTTTTVTTSPKNMYEYVNSNFEDMDFNLEDFEFATSRRFDNVDVSDESDLEINKKSNITMDHQYEEAKKCWRQRHESLPAMAFADDLFCDGKVMPLNPPPCQQVSIPPSPAPASPGTIFKIPYPKRNLWNDDYDPFMAALENVKEGKKRVNHRRAWSMLPACTQWEPDELAGFSDHVNCLHSSPLILSPNKQMGLNGSPFPTCMTHQQAINDEPKSPLRLTEPKGVLFARRVRMVRMGYKGPMKPTVIPISEPKMEAEERGVNCNTENKWQRIISFALRSSTMRKTRNEDKKKDQNGEFSRPKILRKLSFRPKKLGQCNEEKQVSKMTIVRHRPNLLLCMGYGAKYSK